MKVCIETSTFRARFAGIAYYAWFLSTGLLSQEPDIELYGFDGTGFSELNRESLDAALAADSVGRSSSGLYHRARRFAPVRAAYRAYKRQRFARGARSFDLFHAMNFMPPSDPDMPILPLIHDVSHERFAEAHPAERVAWLRKRMRHLDRYPLVNTVSDFSAREIADFYGYPIERIRVTRPGVNPIFRQPPEPEALARLAEEGLRPGGFFLSVGTIEPRKNHDILIEAYARLPKDFRREHPLVFAGQPGWGRMRSRHVGMLREEGSVRFTGYLDEPVLRACYAMATALLFPSLYESFGIPVAEAMATGLPTIVSDIDIMHEVAGPAGRYVAPLDADAWAAAIQSAAELSAADRAEGAAVAIARSEGITWERSARDVAAIYREMLGKHR